MTGTPQGARPALVEGHDVVMFDLDGVIYLGGAAAPGALDGVRMLQERGIGFAYVTNNAARPASTVVEQLEGLGFPATEDDVVTSAQAVVALMSAELPPGASVLVAGTQHLADLVGGAGFTVVASADDDPDAVVQGYNPDLNWRTLEEAGFAVQRGARWYAANLDSSRPTDRGIVPGLGAAVAAVGNTVPGQEPRAAGKPARPLLDQTIERTGAHAPLFVGDRLDTDIAGANVVGIDGCLVLTGVHGKADLLAAPPEQRPSAVIADLPGLFRPARTIETDADGVRCGATRAWLQDGAARIEGYAADPESQLDALWALAHLVWEADTSPDYQEALGALNAVH